MKNEIDLLNAILRNDFAGFVRRSFRTLNPGSTFVPNYHINAIAYQLERIRRGEINRLIINLPPRYLKSIVTSVAFPAFLLGQDPKRRIICLSYGAELAAKHAADCRAIIMSDWYHRAFPQMIVSRTADSNIYTSKHGFRKTSSVGGALTGLGGDLFIIDDPQKPVDAQSQPLRDQMNQWFTNTLLSRLDNKEKSAIIVVMQRVHLGDLTGYLTETSDRWMVLSLPAIAEVDERIQIGDSKFYDRRAGEALHESYESLATLEKLRREMGTEAFNAQEQQAPVPPGGAMIQRRWLRYYDTPPDRSNGARIIQSWDCAGKEGAQNSWSVCTTWLHDRDNYYLLDVVRGRFDYPKLRQTALAVAERYDPTVVLIEDASAGIALAQELRDAGHFRVQSIPVDRDKVTRLYVQAAKFEAGRVYFPKHAPFLAELEAELLTFPQGKHDDQVDSITQALAFDNYGYDESLSWVG
ncbi:putative phage terminase large subunit-like protein [Nitrobacter vulgaris]|uniref:phage terminase large subunit n=1 Tax=Nitrobacter vulgaris TaxID=29421 RepID=UPI00285ECA55|nr:phage terminase large subunit [Nitrobacter vulgaris]MDR6303301.1 putative phage terminase large subunit-like protein [Nitrobacter vulgaris]